jgi:Arc/MetJ-type ribon-helix-helix transcriptional regulator
MWCHDNNVARCKTLRLRHWPLNQAGEWCPVNRNDADESVRHLDTSRAVINNNDMQLTLTRPIEAFIERQLAQGYKDADEVARQALLRWMSEESEIPPNIQTRLDEAASGRFAPGDRSNIERIIASA